MFLGLLLGGGVGLAMLLHIAPPGISWLVAVGLAKLTLAAAGGLLAGGAFLQRLAGRRDDDARRLLQPVSGADTGAADRRP